MRERKEVRLFPISQREIERDRERKRQREGERVTYGGEAVSRANGGSPAGEIWIWIGTIRVKFFFPFKTRVHRCTAEL